MALTPGTRVGPFTIDATLGAGGMGEVYRAHDSRLDRHVALKVLPEAFTSDADRLLRFTREAQLLAALNHPNIAAIYGIEESSASSTGGIRALVLELVEGVTLAERLATGPIAPDEALAIARQIALALDAAHERGIVHRDLKPANVKLTPEGVVKVLDFGLAKALDPSAAAPPLDPANSPTLLVGGTEAGLIIGTAAYMAPEQARGRSVDRRADIWAFGVVLFEMLAGARPFEGEDTPEVLARVLEREPDWRRLPAGVPPAVRRLLQRCLTKDRRERLRDIGDVLFELDDAVAGPSAASGAAPAVTWRRAVTLALALATIVAALAVSTALEAGPAAPARVVTFSVPVTQPMLAPNPVLSPDGSFLVYAGDRLYVHRFERGESQPLAGTEHATSPFVSRDGRWVGYVA